MAEPDLKRGVRALKNRFKLEAPVTREEQDAARIRYERDIAPRLKSITDTYDRMAKRRQDAEIHKLKRQELEASIAKLKEAKETDDQGQDGFLAIQRGFRQMCDIIDNIGLVPDPDDLEGAEPRNMVPASISQMQTQLGQAKKIYNDFGLRSLIINSADKTGYEKLFSDKLAQGEKAIANATTQRDQTASLMSDYEDLLTYDDFEIEEKGEVIGRTSDKYQEAYKKFKVDRNVNDFKAVLRVGKKNLDQERDRLKSRIDRVKALQDRVANKRKFVATTEVQREGEVLQDQVIRRVPNDPIFVRSVYKEYLSLLGDLARSPAGYREYVGRDREAVEGSAGVLEKGHGDETLEEPSSFDEFSEDLYKRIIDYLSDEKNTLDEDARAIGVSAARGADTQVSSTDEEIVDDKLPDPK